MSGHKWGETKTGSGDTLDGRTWTESGHTCDNCGVIFQAMFYPPTNSVKMFYGFYKTTSYNLNKVDNDLTCEEIQIKRLLE